MKSKCSVFMFVLAGLILVTTMFSGFEQVKAETGITADFNQLSSDEILEEMGTGWNLGNQLEATISGTPFETAWGNPVITPALIQRVKSAGFDTIRIPISYLNKIGSGPNYTIDQAWINRIKEVVDYAYNEGMYVIINMHGDGYHTITGGWLLVDGTEQALIQAKYEKVWEQVAEVFIGYDERLIFESMNEVFDGTYGVPNATYYNNLNTYNQIFVNTVRRTGGNNSARWLLVPGWNTNIDYTAGNFGFVIPTDNYRSQTIPSDQKRIMISAHYYSPWDFCGDTNRNITQWGETATDSTRVSEWGQEDYMESQFEMMYEVFVSKGYPVVIGEYGSIDKTSADTSNNEYRKAFAKALNAYGKNYGCVPVYWDNGHNGDGGFALFDRSTKTITQPGIIQAIMEGMNSVIPPDSVISDMVAIFDKSLTKQKDMVINMTLNGNTLTAIKQGTQTLVAGTDYTVMGQTATIKKEYLVSQPIGLTPLTFVFSGGKNSVLTITILDSSNQVGIFKVQGFNNVTSEITNGLTPKFKLVNTGTTDLDLENIKIRYYYTINNEKQQTFTCDWSPVGSGNITGTFYKMPIAKEGADYYLEIGFTSAAGSLGAGQSLEIVARVNKVDWSNYTQTDDYSFRATANNFIDWTTVTAYQSGNLKWGIEP